MDDDMDMLKEELARWQFLIDNLTGVQTQIFWSKLGVLV